MRFTWDENKKHLNLRNHGIGFDEAQTVFDDPLAVSVVDLEHSISEERWLTIGMSRHGQLLIVVHKYWVEKGEELIRIISARKPTLKERKIYEEAD